VLVAFELLEALRWVDWLRPDGMIVVNRQRIIPMGVSIGDTVYPDEGTRSWRRCGVARVNVVVVEALPLAEEAGNTRTVNTIILAALSTLLETDPDVWETAILRRVPQRYADVNRIAFRLGREAAT
jgi:indolepyruvate ferredoxin oxidoreductase, beta subunit